ncbi:hypothetical protein GCM10011584_07560 [Nocardioides phosphati]|uniref:RCK N-terminal domain-containing protein n=1 Tax=Nocardioides phosphati TaxID=1867775 RepID=A0ABQ2N689_9ACTN|nr:NAD-binding protein [Nocardioides phosphati]GGO86076.1 hypothetical protein GCM10011584_07560 [Nocardioides phosphati]
MTVQPGLNWPDVDLPGSRGGFVVIGDTTTARRVCAALTERGHVVTHLDQPGPTELRAALTETVDGVAILLHQDEISLQYAMAVAHAAPSLRLVVEIFDATVSAQLETLLPNCLVTSPGRLAAPVLAARCLDPTAVAITHVGPRRGLAYDVKDDGLTVREWRRSHPRLRALRGWLASQVMPHDAGSTLLTVGLLGMLSILVLDWLWLTHGGVEGTTAFQEAVAVVATVGPISEHGEAYAVFAGVAMLLTLVFAGMFTAGLVDQLLGPRLVGLFGQRALPRSGHVIVVGMGQVGLRLCRHLIALGVPVLGVERDARGRYLGTARNLGIPVVVGHGGDRLLLERLRLDHAAALAAVGSADLDNVSVAVAARGVTHQAPIVIRMGEQESVSESASLLPLGVLCDVVELSAAYVIAHLFGHTAALALPRGRDVLLETAQGEYLSWRAARRDACTHGVRPGVHRRDA